jgi:hypothetical protein
MQSITTSITTLLLTASLMGLLTASLAFSDEPPTQTGEPGTATDTQEPLAPTTEFTLQDEPAQPPEAGDIQERGILSGRVAPAAALQFNAPTASLSAIRNGIRVTAKSVSVNLRIPANLPVTVPVEVSVAYISPAQTQRQTKTYNPATGLAPLYREAEGDGKPRSIHLDITVRELVPNGKSFSVSRDFTITPLYDVSITNLRFTMASFCDRLGKNDITLVWLSPDHKRNELKFDAGAHEEKVIPQFSWARKELSVQADLIAPSIQFFERDLVPDFGYHPIRSGAPLLPGPARQIHDFVLNEKASGPPGQAILSADCQTQIKYLIKRELMIFDQL